MSVKEVSRNLKVLILCGGKGERLNPLTNRTPKPLIPINGTPILTYLISYLELYGLKKIVIAAGHESGKIFEYFENHHKNLDIEIVDSGDVDIIERIRDAAEVIPGDFIMCYGDTLADVNLLELIEFHHKHKGNITITSYPLQSPFGILNIDGSGKMLSFAEKPILDEWINIGYFYFSRECIKHIDKSETFVDFLLGKTEKGDIFSFKHRGIHITVNTITELREAERNIARLKWRNDTLGRKVI